MQGDAGDATTAPFGTVLTRERALIDSERAKVGIKASAPIKALALSGGGIRSATFNLGILQALCERRLLRCFDYLSTVSGGGYIGSWLTAQLHYGRADLEAKLSPTEQQGAQPYWPKADEDNSITFLRQYSNYLTPRMGVLSIDTLSAIAGYLRNVILVQTTLIALLVAVLLVPRVVYRYFSDLQWAGWGALAFLALSLACIAINIRAKKTECKAQTGFALAFVIAPALAAAFLLSIELARSRYLSFTWYAGGFAISLVYGVITAITASAATSVDESETALRKVDRDKRTRILEGIFITFMALGAACVGALALFVLHQAMNGMRPQTAAWFAVSAGPFVVLQILCLIVVFHLGLVGRVFDYQIHEWWARYGAWILSFTIWLGGLFALAVYGPALVRWLGGAIFYAGGPAWLLTTLWGVLWGASSKTGGESRKWPQRLLPLAPYVFIFGLALAASYAIHVLLLPGLGGAPALGCGATGPLQSTCFPEIADETAKEMAAPEALFWACSFCAVFLALYAVLAWRVDINLFSLHGFYRNRLTRCYLGGARIALSGKEKRRPHPFTGFDVRDDLPLQDLAQRPYPILATALNISAGENLAWQHRKAASFFFSPLFCGFEFPDAEGGPRTGGFAQTRRYMRGGFSVLGRLGPAGDTGPMLGSAMAVSGAALSPNSGFHTPPPVAFLLTLFNVRLGRWCPNPAGSRIGAGQAPALGGVLLLRELFALTDSRSSWVYLSDGGHFDNLGIYELVRRRARLIVAVDCGRDIDSSCDDLADTVRKCRVDLGACIHLDVTPLKKAPHGSLGELSERHMVWGRIDYPELRAEKDGMDAPACSGTLLLVKPTLTEAIYKSAPDLRNYALANPEFPQQSTIDQWFDEAQFESYRKLGYVIGRTVLDMQCDGTTVAEALRDG